MENTFVGYLTLTIELLAIAYILGTTVWFFFIQSPVLYSSMDRERFIPVQMRVARLLFTTLFVALIVTMVATIIRTLTLTSLATLTSVIALLAGGLNKFAIFPRALRAGWRES